MDIVPSVVGISPAFLEMTNVTCAAQLSSLLFQDTLTDVISSMDKLYFIHCLPILIGWQSRLVNCS